MRGGIFDDNYQIEKRYFRDYLQKANTEIFRAKEDLISKLSDKFSLQHLRNLAINDEDKNFKRLCFEYMPLKFSRRHGDPSRPWNKFSINMKNEVDGSKILDYQGNWRDIFQNWEALAHSYPEFIDSMVYKFLNATTFDGYNPYRIMRDGFDWETIEADDPWSYIGYWGDHQIIYLLKLLELSEKYYPEKLTKYFNENIFVYANVPYKIKDYEQIVANPKDTLDFDFSLNKKIQSERKILGTDAALLRKNNNTTYQVNFIEKILATISAKLSNFIPEAGIWMNTQRPEWNDANNALVGNGVSMVTLYYLRRFLSFFAKLLSKANYKELEISEEFAIFFKQITKVFSENTNLLSGKISDKDRKSIMDSLGKAAGDYRKKIYKNNFSGNKQVVQYNEIVNFVNLSLKFIEHSIEANKREDKLYHSYNLISIEKKDSKASVSYLSEMLEGQVAVLSSEYINPESSLELLDALKNSLLYRADQNSYILYPNKELARFVSKNNIPKSTAEKSELLKLLIKDNNKHIIEKDVFGTYHFNGNFNNANSLKEALLSLPEQYQILVEKEQVLIQQIFEEVFNHKAFTGRSGTFFGYEGLGSIYWHMVSKLALAVQETCLRAIKLKTDAVIVDRLFKHYYDISEGLAVHKTPTSYGAFPTDPYSHTPLTKGAQQPGMTGQVKEDILTRFTELGISVEDGKLGFKTSNFLSKKEFLQSDHLFKYKTLNNKHKQIKIKKGELCFTYCQVPIIYKISDKEQLELVFDDDSVNKYSTMCLNKKDSFKLFQRTGDIAQIIVSVKMNNLR